MKPHRVMRRLSSHAKVLSIQGGAGKKRKENPNPYVDETPEFPTNVDGAVYQEAFTSSIQIGTMTNDTLDVRALMVACDGATLDFLINHLSTGKAHHNIKIEGVAEMLQFSRSMKRVIKLTENSMDKFKKLMSAKLWALGCAEVGGTFKMENLVSFIKGVRVLK